MSDPPHKLVWSTSGLSQEEYVRNDLRTKWLEMNSVQVNMYVIIFQRSYVRKYVGKYHMYPAFAYCYQNCGSYIQRQGSIELLW